LALSKLMMAAGERVDGTQSAVGASQPGTAAAAASAAVPAAMTGAAGAGAGALGAGASGASLATTQLGAGALDDRDKKSLKDRITGFLGTKPRGSMNEDGIVIGAPGAVTIDDDDDDYDEIAEAVSSSSAGGGAVGGDATDANGWAALADSDDATLAVPRSALIGARAFDAPVAPASLALFDAAAPGAIACVSIVDVDVAGGRRQRCVWATASGGVVQWELASRALLRVIACAATALPSSLSTHVLVPGSDGEPLLYVGGSGSSSNMRAFSVIDRNGTVRHAIDAPPALGGVSAMVLVDRGVLITGHTSHTLAVWQ
jgi:hypothetical protein